MECHRVFEGIKTTISLQKAFTVDHFEYGYAILSYLISRIMDSFNILLLTASMFVCGSVVLSIKRYAVNHSLMALLTFGISASYDFTLFTRQNITVAVPLLAIPAFMKCKLLRYALPITLASQFHPSTLPLFVTYLVSAMRLSTFGDWIKRGAFIGTSILSLSWVTNPLATSSIYYDHYLNSDYADDGVHSVTVPLVIVHIFLTLLVSTCGWEAAMEDDSSGRTRSLLALVVAGITMMAMSLDFNPVSRLEMYLTMFFVIGLVSLTVQGRRSERPHIGALLVIIAFAASTISFLYRPK